MDVYAVYTEIVTYTTKLKLEYYTVADLEKEEYDANPYETLVTDYNDVIKTSSYIPGNIVIFTTTEDGFVNTQVWSFDKWESDLEYQLTGRFTGTDNVMVKLYAKYKLVNESYISTEPEEVTEPEKPEETVKTGDNMPVQIYVLLMFVSGALALTVSSVSKSKRQNRQDF